MSVYRNDALFALVSSDWFPVKMIQFYWLQSQKPEEDAKFLFTNDFSLGRLSNTVYLFGPLSGLNGEKAILDG